MKQEQQRRQEQLPFEKVQQQRQVQERDQQRWGRGIGR
jgi:hypothetical protein